MGEAVGEDFKATAEEREEAVVAAAAAAADSRGLETGSAPIREFAASYPGPFTAVSDQFGLTAMSRCD